MIDVLHREAVYLWYYFSVQLGQIFWYWVLGMVIGSAVSVFGVFMAATIGVPLYMCGGTIPLLQMWLSEGMTLGSAASFMLTGPATKITNLGALKIVLGIKNFIIYLLFVMAFSFAAGIIVNIII